MRLVSRDRAVLAEAFLSKVIRRDDLIALGHFSSVCRCNARLLALRQAGLLTTRDHIVGMKLLSRLYLPTKLGVRIAADELCITQEEAVASFNAGIRDLSLRHSLRCSDIRRRFVQELATGENPTLNASSHELLCHHEFIEGTGRRTVIKPDALATLSWQSQTHCVFIEVDLGNAALPKLRDKFDRYRLYSSTGAFEDAYGEPGFVVLTVTTDEGRLANIVKAGSLPGLLFTTWRRLEQQSILEEAFSTHNGSNTDLSNYLSRGHRV